MKLFFGALTFVCGALFPSYWFFVPAFRTAVRASFPGICALIIVAALIAFDTYSRRRKAIK